MPSPNKRRDKEGISAAPNSFIGTIGAQLTERAELGPFSKCIADDCSCPASYNGESSEYCSNKCRTGSGCLVPEHCVPCTRPPKNFSPCARQNCPCPSSYNGQRGYFVDALAVVMLGTPPSPSKTSGRLANHLCIAPHRSILKAKAEETRARRTWKSGSSPWSLPERCNKAPTIRSGG